MNKLTEHELTALRAFKNANGRTWKAKLESVWQTGCDSQPLQSVRNKIGGSGLAKIRI